MIDMKTFHDIYETSNLDSGPISRSVYDLRTILRKAYELSENEFFSSREIFDVVEDSPIAVHRTTVERMLLEVDKLEGSKTFMCLSSKNIEVMVTHLFVIEKYLEQLPGDEEYARLIFSGQLRGIMRNLVDNVRDGVVGTTKVNIIEKINSIEDIEEKVKYLKKHRLFYKQNEKFIDNKQQEQLIEFIGFEQEKLELDLASPNISEISQVKHSISVATGGIANFNYAVGAVQNLNTGTGAQQNAASGTVVNQATETAPTASIDKLIKQLTHLIVTDDTFVTNRQEMEQQLETVKVQLQKPEPKKGIIKRAFESLAELAADGAGTMAGHAIFEVLHKVPELLTAAGLN